jgi:GLPGLI family protein
MKRLRAILWHRWCGDLIANQNPKPLKAPQMKTKFPYLKNKTMKYSFFILIALWTQQVSSQSLQNYVIKFERKINKANLLKNETWFRPTKENRFHIDSFLLSTNSEEANYEKMEGDEENGYFSGFMSYGNRHIDIKTKKILTQKAIGDADMIYTDTFTNFHWKLTTDTRTILGFECYKAIGKVKDSIEIVAFFAPELQAPIGPESITGLPGTVLGLVVPDLHTTWLAKDFKNLELKPKTEYIRKYKGKNTTKEELEKEVEKNMKYYSNPKSLIIRAIL